MKIITSWWTPLLTICGLIALRIFDPFPVEIARIKGFDYFQTVGSKYTSDNIVLINIDEDAIDKEGQWPWPRARMAALIDDLGKANAKTVVFAFLFAEPDRFLQDPELAESMKKMPVVLAQDATVYRSKGGARRGVSKIGDVEPWLFTWDGIVGPIKLLEDSATGVGVGTFAPEIDGVVRRSPLAVVADGKVYPSIALETVRVGANARAFTIKAGEAGVQGVRVRKLPPIATDQNSRIWLNFNKKYPAYSSNEPFPDLSGKIAVVGLTANGLSSIIATPIGEQYSHQVVSSSIDSIYDPINIKRLDYFDVIELIFIIFICICIVAVLVKSKIGFAFTILMFSFAAIFAISYCGWIYKQFLIDWTFPALALLIVALHSFANRFAREMTLRLQIKRQFEHYLSPPLIQRLQQDPSLLKLGGERRELTLLFCDVRGFTAISEQFKDSPEGLVELINEFLTPMTGTILDNNGTIDKYMGDCIMAFWNAPLDVPSQQSAAARTVISMQELLIKLNDKLTGEGKLPLNIGIGLNTGECIVGNVGSEQRFDYSALGDSVNLASRLEGQTKDYGVINIFSETSLDRSGQHAFVELDKIVVKGKAEAVTIYTCLGTFDDAKDFDFDAHEKLLTLYRSQKWNDAAILSRKLYETCSFIPNFYGMLEQRIQESTVNPPGRDWDGVYRATSK